MKKFSLAVSLAFVVFGLAGPIAAHAATTPSLGAAATYGVLGSTYINPTAGTTVNGDVGFTTGSPVVPAGVHTNYGSGAPYSTAGTDQGIALVALASQPCTFTFAPGAINLSTDTTHGPITVYGPGVYCSTGAMNVGGPLNLTGNGTYIFRPDGALDTTLGSIVTLTGSSACDIFWTPTAATTLGANTTFAGTVIDNAGITIGSTTTWSGRALAFGGTITTGNSTITVPSSCASPATLHVIKLVVNSSGGGATPSNFTVHVKSGVTEVSGSPAAGAAAPGTTYSLNAGTYAVSEDTNVSYVRSFSGDCDSSGNVTLTSGSDKICTIINTDLPPPPPGAGGLPQWIVPLIGVLKVPSPLAFPAGPGPVTYNYTTWNVGGFQALTDVALTDDKCSPISFISGDLNANGKLDPSESWRYNCTMTLATTTTNTVTAIGYSDDAHHQPAIATAVATVVVGSPLPPPLINVVKVPSRLTPFPIGGGDVTYTYTVTNPGVVAMNNVAVTDDKCGPVSRTSGDADGDNLLDTSETWTYTCTTNIAVSTRNVATAKGSANGFLAVGYAFATVLVSAPGLPNTGLPPVSVLWSVLIAIAILAVSFLAYFSLTKKKRTA